MTATALEANYEARRRAFSQTETLNSAVAAGLNAYPGIDIGRLGESRGLAGNRRCARMSPIDEARRGNR